MEAPRKGADASVVLRDDVTGLETIFLGVRRPDLRWTFRFFPASRARAVSYTRMKEVESLERIAPMC